MWNWWITIENVVFMLSTLVDNYVDNYLKHKSVDKIKTIWYNMVVRLIEKNGYRTVSN